MYNINVHASEIYLYTKFKFLQLVYTTVQSGKCESSFHSNLLPALWYSVIMEAANILEKSVSVNKEI